MIHFRAFNIEFRLHVLTLIAAAMAAAFGSGAELPYVAFAVGFHELMHIIAARLCGLKIEYIEIMWFGGAAHIRDIYSAGRVRLVLTALAGPTGNLLAATSAAALCWWGCLGFAAASAMIRINLALMLFNMMPVLPLDGGRVFYGIASIWLQPLLTMKICAAMAYVLAGALAVGAAAVFVLQGVLNITLLLMAVFLTASAYSELRAYKRGSPLRAMDALLGNWQLPAQAGLVVFPADMPASAACRFLSSERPVIFALVENGSVASLVTGEEMAHMILNES